MVEYNRLLSQRVAAYASEINRLEGAGCETGNVCSSVKVRKLRAKPKRQIQEAQERISALQEEMAETLGEQYDPVLPSALRQSSAQTVTGLTSRETRLSGRKRNAVLPVVVNSVLWDVMCQSNWSLSAAPLKGYRNTTSETGLLPVRPYRRHQYLQNPLHAVMPERGFGPCCHRKYATIWPLYRQSGNIPVVRSGAEPCHTGRWTGAVAELLEPLYDVLRQYVLMPGKVHADDIPVLVRSRQR